MAAVRSQGNRTTEMRFRARLVSAGIRGWTVQPAGVIGCPDFAFLKLKLAIFIDGAFWHGAPGFNRFPKSRVSYWSEKIERNKRRDVAVNRALRASGWSVLRFWDYELLDDGDLIIKTILKRLRRLQQRTVNPIKCAPPKIKLKHYL